MIRDIQLNQIDRKVQTLKNKDKIEELDFSEYLFFNSNQKAIEKLLSILILDKIIDRSSSKIFLQKMRLFDSIIKIIITIKITISKSRD